RSSPTLFTYPTLFRSTIGLNTLSHIGKGGRFLKIVVFTAILSAANQSLEAQGAHRKFPATTEWQYEAGRSYFSDSGYIEFLAGRSEEHTSELQSREKL